MPGDAIELADDLLRRSLATTTRSERRRQRRLGGLVRDAAGRQLLQALTDEVLRIRDPRRAMRRLADVVGVGLPPGLGLVDRLGLVAAAAGRIAPRLVKRAVDARVRAETRGVVLPADGRALTRALAERRREGMRLNVNLLGEAILGDTEAAVRLHGVRSLIARPDVDYVSVKISALCANLDVLAFEHSVERISERLRDVFRAAQRSVPAVFVNLDMEEYRDLDLTIAAFCAVLDEEEFLGFHAGVVLQAYIPDSHAAMDELCRWATARAARGGAPIKVRVVKGANLAMERVDAELHGWVLAPYGSKDEVDSSFKRLVLTALAASPPHALRLGVASHNLFDVAWAIGLRAELTDRERIEIEMLSGMAPAQSRVVRETVGALRLYAPVVRSVERDASIAYLSRRLDENSAPDNFLRALFTMTPGSSDFAHQRRRFVSSLAAVQSVRVEPRRQQDRAAEEWAAEECAAEESAAEEWAAEERAAETRSPAGRSFVNEPDTDFTRAANRVWIDRHLAEGVPAAGIERCDTMADIDGVVSRARKAAARWAGSTLDERRVLLHAIADSMSRRRGATLATMAVETHKTVREGDPEVSEAIDFARDAADRLALIDALRADGASVTPRGVVLVAAPWNFPISIPVAGVINALAAGNAVLLKPAPEAEQCGAEIVRQLHAAGVPDDLAQLVLCAESDVGRHLITHEGIDQVVLTGAYDTARMFLDWRPTLRLLAETSGKNAITITAAADLDQAIADLVRSAFGHAGQKCSAASLAIVEASVYDDATFHARVADAVGSLRVGAAIDPATMMAAVIRPPSGALLRALRHLEPGESWLVKPRRLDPSGQLWAPGVRCGVRPGSWFHQTECFGPVLGLMRADDLDHAIALQNATPFGLTGGLHSLDPAEIARWTDAVEVGNAYVNRVITGAVVRRQPFGGWKRSAVGGGAKPGGSNTLLSYCAVTRKATETPVDLTTATTSYWAAWREVFGVAHDESGLHAESNVVRYRPLHRVIARVGPEVADIEIDLLWLASEITGTPLEISLVANETDGELAARVAASGAERLRALTPLSDELRRACHEANVAIDDAAVTGVGRVDLFRFVREQSVSVTRHRHGRLPDD